MAENSEQTGENRCGSSKGGKGGNDIRGTRETQGGAGRPRGCAGLVGLVLSLHRSVSEGHLVEILQALTEIR